MKSNWKEERLGSLVRFSSGGTPNKNNPDYWNGTIPWISAKNMKSEVIETSDLSITEEGLIHGSKIAPKGSLLLLVRGSGLFNGIPVCYLENAVAYNQDVKCIESTSELENKYLFYWLKANSGYLRKKIEFTSIGAGKFDTRFLSNLVVRFPEKVTRKKIIDIADNISDRINVNKKINENLAQQAQAIFVNMFAHNENVIPTTIADVALNVTDGVHNTVHDDPEGEYLLLSCKNIKGGSLSIGSSERRISFDTFEKLRRRTKLSKGDVLISSVGTVGELFLLNEEPSHFEFQRSVAMVKPNTDIVSPAYLYESLVFKRSELINAAHGAVQQCLFISDIAGFPVGIPQPDELHDFDTTVMPMFDIISTNEAENQRLAEMRDTLLPKLMNGELDVSKLDL